MRKRFHLSRTALTLLVLLSVTIAGKEFGRAQSAGDRRLYDNDELFNQLSGAYRTKLERMFGRKQMIAGGKISGEQFSTGNIPLLRSNPGEGILSAVSNTLVNNAAADATSQDTQSETAIVLGSGSVVIAGFNDSGSFLGGASKFTGASRSADGGTSFIDLGALPNNGSDGDAGDPVLARSASTGTIFLSTLSFTTAENLWIFRSTDNGATFIGPAVNSAPGFNSTTGSQDKEWIAVDNFSGAGNGNIYQFWRNFGSPGGMTFTRSTNDGLIWGPSGGTVLISASGQGAFVAVGTDHSVYCFWLSGTQIVLRKSTDLGLTFGAQITVAPLLSTGVNGDLGLGFRTNTFPHAAVNPANGNIYVVYDDKSAGTDRGEVYFRQSTNGGTTWSSQVRVNDDAGTNDQWQPTLAVTPDGTALCVGWYDRRSDPANTLIEHWGTIASISGSAVTFAPNFRVSPQFAPVYGVDPVVNSVYMGDYDQMTADNSFFYMPWGDNRDQSIAVPSRKNANVRFAKIPKAGPGPIMDFASSDVSGGNGNGRVDFDECDSLTVRVKNNGSSTATGITGTLTTSTSNVTIVQSSASFPTLAPGATGAGIFRLSTSPLFVCGTPIVLTLTVSYAGGSDVSVFSLPTGGGDYVVTSTNGATIVAGTTDIGNHGDDAVTPIALPFSYTFYGASYSAVNACSNGNLQFVSTNNDFNNVCLPVSTFSDAIMVHWDDLRTDAAGSGIFTSTSGIAPNRIFNIEWRATYFSSALSLNFEARLYEGQTRFDIIYGTLNGTGSSATVGTQEGTGSRFTQYSCNTAGLSNGQMLTFVSTNCSDGGGDCVPLPIQLASFTGSVVNGNTVRLDWLTLSELNNYGFEVQKSAGQAGTFATIPGSFTPGHGTTNEPHRYSFVDQRVENGTLFYRLRQIDLDGSAHYTEPIRVDVVTGVPEQPLPSEFSLNQNYPNPFNPSTAIRYALPVQSSVRLEVFNTLGQRVALLVDEKQDAGYHTATFENQTLASGVYFYTIEAGRFRASKKLLLLR